MLFISSHISSENQIKIAKIGQINIFLCFLTLQLGKFVSSALELQCVKCSMIVYENNFGKITLEL